MATAAIFLPSFVFVSILNPLIPRLRKSTLMGAFLDAVNISAVGLMLVVTIRLGTSVLTGWPSVVIFILSAVASLRFKMNAVWLVAGGAFLGLLLM